MALIIYPPTRSNSSGDTSAFLNADTLAKISTDDNGNLAFNGKTVGETSLEVAYSTILSKQNISLKSLDLPLDCDTSKSITLALNGISTQQFIDWNIIENLSPKLDTISWNGLALDNIAQKGDSVIITYYRKI